MPQQATVATKPAKATIALLAVNIAVFIAMVASGISFIKPETDQVLRWGADYGPYTLSGQYWRLITSMFLHFGIIHIFGNMWCLWSLGQLAEKLIDSVSLVGLYLITGIGAALLSLSWDPMRVSAGASGAIFGIAGALISVLYFGKLGLQPASVKKLLGYVVRFAFLNLLFGLQGHIDNMAHLGGLVTGLIAGLFLAKTFDVAPEERPARRRMVLATSAVGVILLFVPVVRAKQYAVEFGKGQTALDHDDVSAAIPHLQKYVAARPGDPMGHILLGAALQQSRRFDEATQEFERALAIDPGNAYVQVNLAKIYAYQKKNDKALALFKKGMPQAGADADASAFYLYASALKDAGRLTEAESNIRRSLQLNQNDTDAHKLLAEILTLEGKNDEAAAEIERAGQLTKQAPPDHSAK
ncbi:MAG TPA: rhomboid family intramembrane serine protease [Candidatus Binatia bacterium]|nr:rhomboid family intramembrane serine protease [Candidatus Binatia bacterium]